MLDQDTWLGGSRRDFTATAWSCILLGDGASPEERQRKLELLARRYWKPVYAYIRRRWNKTNEDAKDLTQAFFVWLMETEFLMKVRRERGRFRNFVKTALDRFLSDVHDANQALKRGGGRPALSLEFVQAHDLEPGADVPPDRLLDEEWRRALLADALGLLRSVYQAADKEVQLRVFDDYYAAAENPPSYEELARRYEISVVDVKNYLTRARSKFRDILEQLASESVGDPEQLREELNDLFGEAFDR